MIALILSIMRSEYVISFTEFASHYNGFISDYQYSLFLEPSDFLGYLSNCNGKVIVIGSRPGQGKTSLMLSLIKDASQIPVLVFSLELSSIQLIRRFLHITGETYVSPPFIQIPGHEFQNDINRINATRNIFICDKHKITFETFNSILERQQLENPVKIVFIDYCQLLKDATTDLSSKLKKCAELHHVTIVAYSQLGREIEKNPLETPTFGSFPGLNDPGNIDEAYYLFRPDRYGITQDDKGNCLENLVMIASLKGIFKKNKIIFKINQENSAFMKADLLNFYFEKRNEMQ
jgi:hypothetical protein